MIIYKYISTASSLLWKKLKYILIDECIKKTNRSFDAED